MRNSILLFLIIIFAILICPSNVRAQGMVVSSSAQIYTRTTSENNEIDFRVIRLKNFLSKHRSPLRDYSQEFIYHADANRLDWRLVAAISGVESTFGKRIPKGSYNAYGWANGNFYFNSWEHSIEVVSETLRDKYYDRGATNINKIARRYAPPSLSWAWKVKYFMNEIDNVPVEFDL